MFKPEHKGAKRLDTKKMDLDTLDELISKCEDAMVSPFKKKKEAVAVEIKPEAKSLELGEDEEGEEKPDLSDMDMDDLVRMYQEMKHGKE